VLAKGEVFPNAEERRLFYVAMTRAKKHVFLVDDPRFNSSSFMIEILGGGYDIERTGQLAKAVLCPKCKTGEIISRETKYGILFYCNNYPYCDYRPKICPKCGKNYLVQGDFSWNCSNSVCSFAASVCPWCNQGYVVKRKGRNGGHFYGCSNYPKCRYIKRHETQHSGSLYR
jgi:DNA helicase-4